MYLLLDNSDPLAVSFYFKKQDNWQEYKSVRELNEPLLVTVDQFFKSKKINKKKLLGLGVIVGKGSFTTTRAAVTVVNTLAYAWGIKAVAVKECDQKLLEKVFKETPKGQFVSALYSGEPNIGTPKNKN